MQDTVVLWSTLVTAVAAVIAAFATILGAVRARSRLDELQALATVVGTLPADDPMHLEVEARRARVLKRYVSKGAGPTSFQVRETAVAILMLVGLGLLYLGIFKVIPEVVGMVALYANLVVAYFVSPRDDLKAKVRFIPR